MLYEPQYIWFIFVSSLDLMLTWVILYLGGYEANPLAGYVLNEHGVYGMVAFKMALVVFVILLCEWVGRKSISAGRKLANASIAITIIPVIVAFSLLLR
jgi:hypothetical protein